jgi:hypothetical protein
MPILNGFAPIEQSDKKSGNSLKILRTAQPCGFQASISEIGAKLGQKSEKNN